MAAFHWLQVVLPAVAAVLTLRQLRVLFGPHAMDGATYLDAVDAALQHGGRDQCAALVARLPRGDLSELTASVLASDGESTQLHDLLQARQLGAVEPLRALTRMALPTAFLGALLELSAAFGGGQGLIALQRGLAEHIAIHSALLGFAIGLGTSLFCATAARLLQSVGRERVRALGAVMRLEARLTQ